jgi:hypothetical protein
MPTCSQRVVPDQQHGTCQLGILKTAQHGPWVPKVGLTILHQCCTASWQEAVLLHCTASRSVQVMLGRSTLSGERCHPGIPTRVYLFDTSATLILLQHTHPPAAATAATPALQVQQEPGHPPSRGGPSTHRPAPAPTAALCSTGPGGTHRAA